MHQLEEDRKKYEKGILETKSQLEMDISRQPPDKERIRELKARKQHYKKLVKIRGSPGDKMGQKPGEEI